MQAATHAAVATGFPERLRPAGDGTGRLDSRILRPLLELFIDAGEEHRQTVARFGRFPHRNRILGPPSTANELTFLARGAKTNGQVPSVSGRFDRARTRRSAAHAAPRGPNAPIRVRAGRTRAR